MRIGVDVGRIDAVIEKDLEDLRYLRGVALGGAECGVSGIKTVFVLDGCWGFEAETVFNNVFFAVAAG